MTSLTRSVAATAALGLALAAGTGCTNDAGLTNGPPPVSTEKQSTRSDLPTPEAPDKGTAPGSVNTAGGNDLGGTGSSGGTAARSGGKEGAEANSPDAGKGDSAVRATPNAVDAPGGNSAAGGTQPAGDIKVGTPKSPQ